MTVLDLVNNSPEDPFITAVPPLPNASNLVVIDNYDSFTWNIYQYLVLEGATVKVYRNDQITLERLITEKPTQLVISPGPGHPQTDSGLSRDAITHFAGKIPVLGVCMGEQCIYEVYGGQVSSAGEILHGKTSPLTHDSKGVYANLPQNLPVTRYHSLAGTHSTLPNCLEVSSWVPTREDGGKGVIMGVRHKEYVVEGVQFHPESILTADGRVMLKNFLHMQGGTWAENERLQKAACLKQTNDINGSSGNKKEENILDLIFERRKLAVSAQKAMPGYRLSDLQGAYNLGNAPKQVSLVDRLLKSPFPLSLMAEIKRASPSKGIISLSTCAPAQARTYALAGASLISILTEPEWFKGSIQDLREVRQALEGMTSRPAVLRKEFIFDEYQILEARLAGADTVLLIVKMLDNETLTRLYKYSLSLGMEPVVEVNTAPEMTIAMKLNARVIGINNRNLVSFEVDLETTSRLMGQVSKDTIVCALSGISGPKDVEAYKKDGVSAVLVGEALMRAPDPAKFIAELLGSPNTHARSAKVLPILVKICGTRTVEGATAAVLAGADFVGMIMVPGRKRSVTDLQALSISKFIHDCNGLFHDHENSGSQYGPSDFFARARLNATSGRPLLVGVFQNQPLEEVLEKQKRFNLDVIQLHGDEPLEWASRIPVPVIKSFIPTDPNLGRRSNQTLPLLDSASGGSGEKLNMTQVKDALQKDSGLRIILAGGLDADNVAEVLHDAGEFRDRILAVDVSSGVEEDGVQNADKIKAFITAAKIHRRTA